MQHVPLKVPRKLQLKLFLLQKVLLLTFKGLLSRENYRGCVISKHTVLDKSQQNQRGVSDFEHTPKSQHFMIFEYCSLCRYDMIMTMIQMRREGCVYDFKMRMCCFYDEVER